MCDERSSAVEHIAAVAVHLALGALGMIADSHGEQSLVVVGSSRPGLVVIELVGEYIGAVAGSARRLEEL